MIERRWNQLIGIFKFLEDLKCRKFFSPLGLLCFWSCKYIKRNAVGTRFWIRIQIFNECSHCHWHMEWQCTLESFGKVDINIHIHSPERWTLCERDASNGMHPFCYVNIVAAARGTFKPSIIPGSPVTYSLDLFIDGNYGRVKKTLYAL